ncbi:hypothetical protein MHIB_41190 [Mycolicibacter hiberniae]|uniref:Uncharacterized protein n=1 Tax=Mycolicibacter hiberniae TaxID=29314 RepID=A0A7I7XAT0_9MYCO|nr:hypothetical protein MHIB_41190 [Mycolicibacter hiberniae]
MTSGRELRLTKNGPSGRNLGGAVGGFAAGVVWGSLIGPEGSVIAGLLGAAGGGLLGDKIATWGLGG